jgi:hypothetical protein
MKRIIRTRLLMASAGMLALACASGGGSSGNRVSGCRLAAQDSVFLARGPVYRDCAVDVRAVQLNNVPLDYRPTTVPRGTRCYEAQLLFVVDTRGVPEVETARVVRASDSGLSEALLRTLPQWRYRPAQKDGVPVRQIVTMRREIAVGVVVVRSGSPPPPPPRC